MTNRVKIAVSLPAELVEVARRCVSTGRATSVSAYVAEALEQYARSEDLLTCLRQSLESSGGPPSAEELAWADEILGR
jgi:Arc/MetJ-type ribon-helix-helix transcriptional regulator